MTLSRSHLAAICATALLAALLALAPANAAVLVPGSPLRPNAAATLDECLTAGEQDERAATFAGEMATIPGTVRMEMRIDVLERLPGALEYRVVTAPGLGVWRSSTPGVKVYRYLKQVTNLDGPAYYRAVVRYRWLGPKGRLLETALLHTRRCEQPSTSAAATPEKPVAGAPIGG